MGTVEPRLIEAIFPLLSITSLISLPLVGFWQGSSTAKGKVETVARSSINALVNFP